MIPTALLSAAAELRRLGFSEKQIVAKLEKVNLDHRFSLETGDLKEIAAWAVANFTPASMSKDRKEQEQRVK